MNNNSVDPNQAPLRDEASLRPVTREEKASRDGYVITDSLIASSDRPIAITIEVGTES